jgi:hypothetical protein
MKKINLPEYYRQFQTQKGDKQEEVKKTESPKTEQITKKTDQKPGTQKPSQTPATKDKTILFQGNGFTLNQLEDWEDQTIYTIVGPVTDGVQHNIIITVDKESPFDTLEAYAEWHIKTLETDLKSCTLLKKGKTKMANGNEAYEVIYSWYPTDELRIYQHQIFTQVDGAVYKITASFTKKTRKTIGPAIERMMLSLNPIVKK